MNANKKLYNPEVVKEYTKSWAKTIAPIEPQKEQSERAIGITKIIMGLDFGCKKESVAKLISAVIGEEVVLPLRPSNPIEVDYYPGVMVVVSGSDNGHDYPIGAPLLCVFGRIFLKRDGYPGNSLTRNRSLVRPATDEEIDSFFA